MIVNMVKVNALASLVDKTLVDCVKEVEGGVNIGEVMAAILLIGNAYRKSDRESPIQDESLLGAVAYFNNMAFYMILEQNEAMKEKEEKPKIILPN